MRILADEIGVSNMDQLRGKTPAELKEDLRTLRAREIDLKFQRVYGQMENNRLPKWSRKNIARVLTVLREKQIQRFLLNDPEVQALIAEGKITLSAGKNDPPHVIQRSDLDGSDARAITLTMRLWARLRKNPDFFRRTQHIDKV